ncbi:MAG TPA: hypothetical protein VKA84_08500 [Gemmatimonadaceae bacterium]|nr:hypothetical protein [Gemmatimonadaceae bacterium]
MRRHDRDNMLPFGRRDDELTRVLREEYGAPSDRAYWDSLEARVLARTLARPAAAGAGAAALTDEWWEPFAGWVRAGLVAACAAVLTAAAALAYTRSAEARLAYESVLETPLPLPSQVAASTPGLSAREATLRYVIGP